MKLKPLFAFMAAFFIFGAVCFFVILRPDTADTQDVMALNDITQSLGERWGNVKTGALPGRSYHIDYAVVDLNGNLLSKTDAGSDTTQATAVKNRDTVMNIESGGKIVGSVIFTNSVQRSYTRQRQTLIVAGILMLTLPLLFCLGFAIYLRRVMITPFRRLDSFARRVAAGNLDMPLEMDRSNIFGPFTESFDLMRTELARAKHNEYLANRSKKELVASLSHDIKTPVASIQAVTELMLVQETNPEARKNLDTITGKTKQITALVTDLFHASLEELQKLKVTSAEESSVVVSDLLCAADYGEKAEIAQAPQCMLNIDRLRLSQVFDNIFANSYKYAGTSMKVDYSFESSSAGGDLAVTISDHGFGAPEGSLPLLCNKFYRGENAVGKSGSGLGLYLARYLMEQMGGGLTCANITDGGTVCGFAVKVLLPLAGRNI